MRRAPLQASFGRQSVNNRAANHTKGKDKKAYSMTQIYKAPMTQWQATQQDQHCTRQSNIGKSEDRQSIHQYKALK